MTPDELNLYINNLSHPVNDKTPVSYLCISCGACVSLRLKALKSKVKRQEILRCRNCSIRDLWKNDEYKNKLIHNKKNIFTDEVKNKISESSKKSWSNEDYIRRQREKNSDPIYIRESQERSIEIWKDPNFRQNQLTIRSSREWKDAQSQIMKKLWESVDYRKATLSSLSLKFSNGFKSSLEVITAFILRSYSIEYVEQKVEGPWIFDFFLPSHNTYIECQGEYWHSKPETRSKDSAKFTYLDKFKPTSKILYLMENEFLNPEELKKKIINFLNIELKSSMFIDFSFKEVLFHKLDENKKEYSKKFLDSHHYARFGRAAKVIYGAYINSELIAVCKFSPPVRNEIASSIGLSYKNVLELDRFCIDPKRHKRNFASWFLSRCVENVFKDYPNISHLVSFADGTYGHVGTIYRSANWKLVGKTDPDYYYVTPDGWVLHKKTLYNHAVKNKKTESEYALENGYSKMRGKEKFKFVYARQRN